MKIASIHIKGFQQFQDVFLDFTHPETGEPLDKICLIGRNGTGKTTLLAQIEELLTKKESNVNPTISNPAYLIAKLVSDNKAIYRFRIWLKGRENTERNSFLQVDYESSIDLIENWREIIKEQFSPKEVRGLGIAHLTQFVSGSSNFRLKDSSNDLLILSPAESNYNLHLSLNDVPAADVNQALALFNQFPFHHTISSATVSDFWKTLIYQLKKRESDQQEAAKKPENQVKTVAQFNEDFEKEHPKILNRIGELWNRILESCGLEFDVEGASNPIQLNDNLKAYIRVKATGQRIQYNQLSTGIRNFIFRLGHIQSLYFGREIKRGFLLVDEPENSLFPDFLYDLIDLYKEVTTDKNGENNTQQFFATHNPIIAAQFEPFERIVLDWNEDGTVQAKRGVAPIGDDPNDLLEKDFAVRELMGQPGLDKHAEYLRLRRQLREAKTEAEKIDLAKRVSEIGRQYEFE